VFGNINRKAKSRLRPPRSVVRSGLSSGNASPRFWAIDRQ
jgi:hypothetical protein